MVQARHTVWCWSQELGQPKGAGPSVRPIVAPPLLESQVLQPWIPRSVCGCWPGLGSVVVLLSSLQVVSSWGMQHPARGGYAACGVRYLVSVCTDRPLFEDGAGLQLPGQCSAASVVLLTQLIIRRGCLLQGDVECQEHIPSFDDITLSCHRRSPPGSPTFMNKAVSLTACSVTRKRS